MLQTIKSQRILIVDDEPLVLSAMESLLGFDGHRVETVSDGESALEKLALHPFDIVFTDLDMPKMPGDVLAKAIKKQSPQQIVVMVTGSAEPVDRNQSKSASFDFTLSKPFRLHEIRDIIRKAALKRAAQNPKFAVVCKQDWLSIQRHLHKGGHAEYAHPFGHKIAAHF